MGVYVYVCFGSCGRLIDRTLVMYGWHWVWVCADWVIDNGGPVIKLEMSFLDRPYSQRDYTKFECVMEIGVLFMIYRLRVLLRGSVRRRTMKWKRPSEKSDQSEIFGG